MVERKNQSNLNDTNDLSYTMRKHITLLLLLATAIALPATASRGHNIQVQLNGFQNQELILGYYFNKRMYVTDTVPISGTGLAVFQQEEALPGGLYLFYLPNGKYFDVLINDEQNFSIQTDTADLVGKMQITGAKEPGLFLAYQRFLMQKQKESEALRNEIKANEGQQARVADLSQQLQKVNQEVADYWDRAVQEHPETFFASFIKAMRDPEIPDFELPANTSNPDSLLQAKRYHYYKAHYFDNIDFQDERLLRTPFFVNKLEQYFERVLPQIPDTVSEASIHLIEQSRGNEEMFRFLVQFLFNRANESKIMGMDAAMVALAERYYLSGEADWSTDEFLEQLRTRVREIKPTLLGNTARDLQMESLDGPIYRLHEVQAPVTVLVFYEPSCGHCKTAIPKLYKEVFLPYRNKGVQVFAVYSMADKEEWQSFVDQHGLHDWLNVYDPYHQTRFRAYYDIRSTPMIYVLDRDKKIAAKRLDVEQLPGFIDHLLKQ